MIILKRNIISTFVLVLCICLIPIQKTYAAEKELVILDSDMIDIFDDGVAMMMLAKAPNIKLLGVTTVTGNSWTEDGTASAIRQLEGIGVTNVPVAVTKTPYKIRKRFANLDKEFVKFGRGFDFFIGAAAHEEPTDWKTAYIERYNAEPTLQPIDENAVDFMIRTIKENPNRITLVAIGPHTNLAAMIKKAPEVVLLIKKIVYMGGSFFHEGNITPAAEFNIWVDPVSSRKVVRSPFNKQIFLPLDACEKVSMTKDEYLDLMDKVKSPIIKDLMQEKMDKYGLFADYKSTLIWDALAAAYVINSDIVEEEFVMPIDVNDVRSPSYGETLAYRRAPEGTQNAKIIINVDEGKVKQIIKELFENI